MTQLQQCISIPVQVGDRVTLLRDVDVDNDGGSASKILFEGCIETYNPQTNLLEFRESDIGYSEFHDLLDEAEGIEVI